MRYHAVASIPHHKENNGVVYDLNDPLDPEDQLLHEYGAGGTYPVLPADLHQLWASEKERERKNEPPFFREGRQR